MEFSKIFNKITNVNNKVITIIKNNKMEFLEK